MSINKKYLIITIAMIAVVSFVSSSSTFAARKSPRNPNGYATSTTPYVFRNMNVYGTITAISSGGFTVTPILPAISTSTKSRSAHRSNQTTATSTPIAVNVSSKTMYRDNGKQISLNDLTIGEIVDVMNAPSASSTMTARMVTVGDPMKQFQNLKTNTKNKSFLNKLLGH